MTAAGLLTHAAEYASYGTPISLSDSALQHPHILPLYDYGATDDPTGLVYLRARTCHPTSSTLLTGDPVPGVIGGPASTFNLTDPSGRIAPLVLAGAAVTCRDWRAATRARRA